MKELESPITFVFGFVGGMLTLTVQCSESWFRSQQTHADCVLATVQVLITWPTTQD